jgi:conjugal transfer/type IV secretion protein DotA/TraY
MATATPAIPENAGYTADSLVNASQQATGDLSAQSMLVKIFGSIADNPLAALDGTAGSGDILGTIFMFINMGLLTLGSIYLSYKALAAVTQTAHDGDFMGKSFNSVWVPVRITTGIFTLLPIAGGWSLLQVAMLWFGIMGAGLGNMAWQGVVGAGWLPFQTAALRPVSGTATDRELVPELFRMHVCAQTLTAGGHPASAQHSVGRPGLPEELRFGTAGNAECGRIYLSHTAPDAGNSAQRRAVEAAANTEFAALSQQVGQLAQPFATAAIRTAYDFNSPDVPRPTPPSAADFARISREYHLRTQAAIAGAIARTDALSPAHREMQQRAQSDGFTTAGAFYNTLARSANQVNQLAAGAAPTLAARAVGNPTVTPWRIAEGYLQGSRAVEQDSAVAYSPAGGNQDAAWRLVMSEMGTDSVGQGIVNRITQDDAGQPVLLRLKNLGDYMVNVAAGAITAAGAVEGMIAAAEKASDGVPLIGGGVSAAAALLTGPLARWLDVIATAGQLAMGFFLMCSVFLPLIPFIVFLGQVLNWLITVVEGVAAAPFLAFAHFDTDGEGLGHKTQYGYTFMLSSFMRPVMLVLGFVFACALLEVIGGYLLDVYPLVIADAQGDSMTGFFGVLGLTAIFFLLAAGLVNSCMSVMCLLPDAIFQFVGAHSSATAQIGRDTATAMAGGVLAGGGITRKAMEMPRRGSDERRDRKPTAENSIG